MALSEDQKAMLRLLAQREQGYEDLAALMGLSVAEVRAKVTAALEQLEAEGESPPLPAEPPGSEEPPAPTPAAEHVKEEPTPPPEPPRVEEPESAPAKAVAEPVKRPRPSRPKISLPSASGARAAIAAGVAVVALLIVILLVSGGSSGETTTTTSSGSTTASEKTASSTTANSNLTQAVLTPVNGGNAKGVAIFGRIKKNVVLQVQAEGLEPSPKGSSYTVWLYKSPKLALRIGSVNVTKSGGIAAQFPLPTELLAYVASGAFDQIDLSLTSNAAYEAEIAKAKKEKRLPAYTGTDVLRGKITGPAIEAAKSKG
jgi:hypothetical protein